MIKRMVSVLLAVMMVVSVMSTGVVTFNAAEVPVASIGDLDEETLYFDSSTTGWEFGAKSKVAFYIFGGDFNDDDHKNLSWGSKKALGTAVAGMDGVISFKPAAKGLVLNEGVQYKIIFGFSKAGNGAIDGGQTYDLFFTTDCLGKVAYCDGTEYENPVDSSKKALAAYWRDMDSSEYGPVLAISSIGNVVGTCPEKGKTPYDILVEFFTEEKADFQNKTGYQNAHKYKCEIDPTSPGYKTEQKLIDDIGAGLGLSKDEVRSIINRSDVIDQLKILPCSWRYDKSTLPKGEVPTEVLTPTEEVPSPTEPPTEAPPEPTVAPEPTDAPIHYHDLVFVPQVDPDYNKPGTAAHFLCMGCGVIFADVTGIIMLSEEDLYLPPVVPTEPPWHPTEAPIPTEAPPVPTEAPIPATEPNHPYDPSDYIYLNVDGALYEVEAGSDHTYSYYLNVNSYVCGVDAKITWDTPGIHLVGDPSFPLLGDVINFENIYDDSENVVFKYYTDTDGYINEVMFNYTNVEGVAFDSYDSMLVTFTIHIADDIRPGMYDIHTDIKVLEGEEEEKLIFEGVDCNPYRILQREGLLDDCPGYLETTYYYVDEQTYTTYSYEDKTFTVSAEKDDDLTYSKFRALYIDGMLVSYNDFTKESGSLNLTLKADYMQRMECGDHDMLFVFSDGEAYSVLHILQGSPATPDEPGDIPSVGGKTINFYLYSTGWSSNSEVLFYVYEVSTGGGLIPWGSKKLIGTNRGDGICSYDPSSMNLVPGIQYAIIFADRETGDQTYDLLFDTSCLGDVAYCTGNRVENPVDCYKTSQEARWKNHSDLGPRLQITSIGNVIGETCPRHTTPYAMFVEFLKYTMDNARQYLGKSDQQLLDDIASRLNLSSEDVNKAIAEAGVRVDWTPPYVPPTEPPTDSYGYIPGEYYLTGSINGDNSGTTKVHKGLRFKDYSSDSMILEGVRLTQGDVVRAARYNGKNTFTVYPDGVGRDVSITQSGRYDFYFKPYELGNGNYWYITPSYLGAIEPYLLGDADGNGELSSADAAYILRYLAKIDTPYTKAELMRGDVDDSGDLELTDVTAIQYYLANMNTPYPIGTTIG